MSPLWHDEGAWIAIGVTVPFIVAGLAMHRIFVRILKNGLPETPSESARNLKVTDVLNEKASPLKSAFAGVALGFYN